MRRFGISFPAKSVMYDSLETRERSRLKEQVFVHPVRTPCVGCIDIYYIIIWILFLGWEFWVWKASKN